MITTRVPFQPLPDIARAAHKEVSVGDVISSPVFDHI